MFDPTEIKKDFPVFHHNSRLVYLDSTATALKPQTVVAAITRYYTQYSANVFRGIYQISEKATKEYEKARVKVAKFINADPKEIVFVRNTSEAINLVLYSWATENVGKDDEVITSIMEHHSNFVTWQQLAEEVGCTFTPWPVSEDGQLQSDTSNISKKTKLIALTHVSNVLGTINPIAEITKAARKQNPDVKVLIDAAQSVPHMPVDVKDLDCDFLAFSAHKMLGPTGVGVLWGRKELLESMKPFNYGGEMIKEVRVDKTYFADIPHKFEAGTPNIAGVIGLGSAVDYLSALGMEHVRTHEQEIIAYALKKLAELPFIKIFGPTNEEIKGGVVAFSMDNVHAHDVSQMLDAYNIATRSGHHCTMPLHFEMKKTATIRASFYVYTTRKDIDKLVEGLEKVHRKFKM